MRLADDPNFELRTLRDEDGQVFDTMLFTCPADGCLIQVRVSREGSRRVDKTRFVWHLTGESPNLTLTPSVDVVGHWHGHVTAGNVGQ